MSLSSSIIHSPLGDLFAISDESSLLFLDFADSRELIAKIRKIKEKYGEKIISQKNHILTQTEKELGEYFAGKREIFSIPIEFYGTEFQVKSWKGLQSIPYSETRSYMEQAIEIGSPKAVRAIGGANHNNPLVIIIPCHRVIGKSGKLIGYGGGLERKIWLLEHEKKYKL